MQFVSSNKNHTHRYHFESVLPARHYHLLYTQFYFCVSSERLILLLEFSSQHP